MSEFKPEKGMSYTQRKKHIDCNEKEKIYKIAYCKYLKNRKINRDPEKYSSYNLEYNKKYYQKHKEKLKEKSKIRYEKNKDKDE